MKFINKRVIPIFLSVLLVLLLIPSKQSAYANTAVASPNMIASAKYLAPILAPFAPEVAFVACVLVAGGVIYQNREQVITMAGSVYNEMKLAGYSVGNTVGKGYSLSLDGVNFLKDKISQLTLNPTITTSILPSTSLQGFSGVLGISYPVGTKMTISSVAQPQLANVTTFYYPTTLTLKTTYPSGWFEIYASQVGYYGGVPMNYTNWYQDTQIKVQMPSGTPNATITTTFPTGVIAAPTSTTIPYNPGATVVIPSGIPLTSDVPLAGDWTGDLVGTSDYTKAFPLDTPVDTTGTTTSIPQIIDDSANTIANKIGGILTKTDKLWKIITQSSTITISEVDNGTPSDTENAGDVTPVTGDSHLPQIIIDGAKYLANKMGGNFLKEGSNWVIKIGATQFTFKSYKEFAGEINFIFEELGKPSNVMKLTETMLDIQAWKGAEATEGVAEAVSDIEKITAKWGNFKCVECANEIKANLLNKGLHGEQIELMANNKGMIVSDTYSFTEAISTNGYHTGILYEGKVYDNIHKTGIILSDWINDFYSSRGIKVLPSKPF